jgi:hypothetical protein
MVSVRVRPGEFLEENDFIADYNLFSSMNYNRKDRGKQGIIFR